MNAAHPKTTALLSYFGSNRMLASEIGKALEGCKFVAIPFGGGFCELLHINARTMIVGDRNRAAINLVNILKDRTLGPMLIRRLRREAFHPDTLAEAQAACQAAEFSSLVEATGLFFADPASEDKTPEQRLEWARAYFIASWMGRGGATGTDGEFDGGMSIRFDASGGDSNTRYRSSVNGLMAWRRIMPRCNFYCEDFRVLIGRVKDDPENAIYADSPWFGAGDGYKHKFSPQDHRDLARLLSVYKRARVVVRYDLCEMTKELYPGDKWDYRHKVSRSQSNGAVSEVVMTNRREL